MNRNPDVLGMKMPAALKTLEAAGVSYSIEIIAPARGRVENGEARVVRQLPDGESGWRLWVCDVEKFTE